MAATAHEQPGFQNALAIVDETGRRDPLATEHSKVGCSWGYQTSSFPSRRSFQTGIIGLSRSQWTVSEVYWPKDWIEHIAVTYTIQRVFQDDLIVQIADELVALQDIEDNSMPLLRRQLADTERGIENMLNVIQQASSLAAPASGWRNWSSCVTM